ncbi:MAG: hypothetical protein ABIQ88_09540 [Chitinophagaceae bacterium]
MSAKTFVRLMLLLMVFTTGLMVFGADDKKVAQKDECPAGNVCTDDIQAQAADVMIWESVSRHLLSVVQ